MKREGKTEERKARERGKIKENRRKKGKNGIKRKLKKEKLRMKKDVK